MLQQPLLLPPGVLPMYPIPPLVPADLHAAQPVLPEYVLATEQASQYPNAEGHQPGGGCQLGGGPCRVPPLYVDRRQPHMMTMYRNRRGVGEPHEYGSQAV